MIGLMENKAERQWKKFAMMHHSKHERVFLNTFVNNDKGLETQPSADNCWLTPRSFEM